MTVKLVLLKSGEKLISDVKEGFIEDKLVCYLLEKPCTITVNGSYKILDEEDTDTNNVSKVSISLQSWPAFSKQELIEMIPSWVISLVEPNDQIKERYETQVLGLNKEEIENDETVSIIEQSDSSLTD